MIQLPRPILFAGFVTSLVVGVAAQAAELEPGWTSLFNGRDLTGWTVKCKLADRTNTFWKVQDGAIVGDSMGVAKHDYIWLLTDQEYGDFTLRLKFQAFHDSPGNTGIQIRSRYDDAAGWLDGPQIDINPPGPWRTGMVWDETRGNQRWLWPDIPKGQWVNESMANPSLKFFFASDSPAWNDMEITARGTKIEAVLNGVRIMQHDGKGVLDDETHAQRRVGMKGHIVLQIHTGDRLKIRYKDIVIRNLEAGATGLR
jgi:hypothetical protein